MMIDLKAIKRAGKTSESFFFEYDKALETPLPNVEISLPIKVTGEVFLAEDGGADIEGEIAFTLKGECTRCLEQTERTIVVGFNEACGSDCDIPIINDRIDLSKAVEEIVIVNIPITFLCKEDCKGLCPACGANLNLGEHKCNNK